MVAALFAAGLTWMRRLSQPQQISRFLVVDRTARARDLERLLGQVEDGARVGGSRDRDEAARPDSRAATRGSHASTRAGSRASARAARATRRRGGAR